MAEKSCNTCKYNGKAENEAPCVECSKRYQNKYTQMTNGDRIRMMTDEELAEFISNIGQNCIICDSDCIAPWCRRGCVEQWLQEVAT